MAGGEVREVRNEIRLYKGAGPHQIISSALSERLKAMAKAKIEAMPKPKAGGVLSLQEVVDLSLPEDRFPADLQKFYRELYQNGYGQLCFNVQNPAKSIDVSGDEYGLDRNVQLIEAIEKALKDPNNNNAPFNTYFVNVIDTETNHNAKKECETVLKGDPGEKITGWYPDLDCHVYVTGNGTEFDRKCKGNFGAFAEGMRQILDYWEKHPNSKEDIIPLILNAGRGTRNGPISLSGGDKGNMTCGGKGLNLLLLTLKQLGLMASFLPKGKKLIQPAGNDNVLIPFGDVTVADKLLKDLSGKELEDTDVIMYGVPLLPKRSCPKSIPGSSGSWWRIKPLASRSTRPKSWGEDRP